MIRELLAVGCGGAAGSIVRYLLSGGIMAGQTLLGFPAGTFTVNAAGSLLIGIFGRRGAPAACGMLHGGGGLRGAERGSMHCFCSRRHVDRNDI